MNTFVVISNSVKETHKLARQLLKQLSGSGILALHGDLGSGKTCFVQGLAAALEIHRPVTSPTFTLVHEYHGNRPLVHVDLYRLRDSRDALMLGLEEYFESDGIVAIEWADRARDIFPPHTIHISFETMATSKARKITIQSVLEIKCRISPKLRS
jgi:tRNA threonylcarbamoyladenosine biosynthesis protein TsaE